MADPGGPDTVEVGREARMGPRSALAAVVVALLVVVGVVAVRERPHDHRATTSLGHLRPGPPVDRARKIVPWRDLEPGHPVFHRDRNGVLVTPFDQVSASGTITGALHGGDTLVFDAVLVSPGLVSLRPCPDYTITVDAHEVTRQLNCSQVPYYASLVRPGGRVTAFRPVLPAGTSVSFRMAVTVPEAPGVHQVQWTLDGPRPMPGFSGTVRVS